MVDKKRLFDVETITENANLNGNFVINIDGATKQIPISSQIASIATGIKTFVVGTTGAGHTALDCDFLCEGIQDQNVIAEAINALPDNGGIIKFLAGTYYLGTVQTGGGLLAAALEIEKPNVQFIGAGQDSTILKYVDYSDGTDINGNPTIPVLYSGIRIKAGGFSCKNMQLNGSYWQSTPNGSAQQALIVIEEGADNCTIENCKFIEYWERGSLIISANNCKVNSITISFYGLNSYRYSIDLTATSSSNRIENFDLIGAWAVGSTYLRTNINNQGTNNIIKYSSANVLIREVTTTGTNSRWIVRDYSNGKREVFGQVTQNFVFSNQMATGLWASTSGYRHYVSEEARISSYDTLQITAAPVSTQQKILLFLQYKGDYMYFPVVWPVVDTSTTDPTPIVINYHAYGDAYDL